MRKLMLFTALLSVIVLTNCGRLKRESAYSGVVTNVRTAQAQNVEDDKPFITSADMFTVKKDVQPFVTSQPMFKFKRPEDRVSPHLMDRVVKSESAAWFVDQVRTAPKGYDVNHYKLKPKKPVEDDTTFVYDDYVKTGDVKDNSGAPQVMDVEASNMAVDAPVEEAEIAMANTQAYVNDDKVAVLGIDSNVNKEAYAVPNAEEPDETYKDMPYGDKPYALKEDMEGEKEAEAATTAPEIASATHLEGKVFFDHGSSKIKPTDKAKIGTISTNIKAKDKYKVNVVGHASMRVDGVSDEELKKQINQKMSSLRANSVKNELKSNGIKSDMILTVSKGAEDPNSELDGMTQEAADRRVEIYTDGI